MTVGEFRKALDSYPDGAKIVMGISIPELYINTVAHGKITGDTVDPSQCSVIQILAVAPPRQHANTGQQGAVQTG